MKEHLPSAESAETIRKRCKTKRKLRKNVTPGIVAEKKKEDMRNCRKL